MKQHGPWELWPPGCAHQEHHTNPSGRRGAMEESGIHPELASDWESVEGMMGAAAFRPVGLFPASTPKPLSDPSDVPDEMLSRTWQVPPQPAHGWGPSTLDHWLAQEQRGRRPPSGVASPLSKTSSPRALCSWRRALRPSAAGSLAPTLYCGSRGGPLPSLSVVRGCWLGPRLQMWASGPLSSRAP